VGAGFDTFFAFPAALEKNADTAARDGAGAAEDAVDKCGGAIGV
jgi:hypothetical protein